MDAAQLADTISAVFGRILRADIKGFRRLMRVNSLFHPKKIVWNFSNTKQLFETTTFSTGSKHSPLPKASQKEQNEFSTILNHVNFNSHKEDRKLTAFIALKNGKVVFENYYQGTGPSDIRIGWSVSKGLISVLCGILIDKKLIAQSALDAPITPLLPSLIGTGYNGVTLRNLLHMTSGVAFNEDYIDYHSDINKLGRILGIGGSMDDFAATLVGEYTPNTWRHYVSIDTHVIGMALRALTGEPVAKLYQTYLMDQMGFEVPPHCITDSYDQPFVLGGMNFCTRDYARIGQMMLQDGEWNGRQIVSKEWIEALIEPTAPPPYPPVQGTPDAECKYGMHWWRPPNPENGEFFAIGIYGQMIYVNKKANLVLVQNAVDLNFREGKGQVLLDTLKLYSKISNALHS